MLFLTFLFYFLKFKTKKIEIKEGETKKFIDFKENSIVLFKNVNCINASFNGKTNIFGENDSNKHVQAIYFRDGGYLNDVSILNHKNCISQQNKETKIISLKREKNIKTYALEYDYYELYDFMCDTIDFVKTKSFYYKFKHPSKIKKQQNIFYNPDNNIRQCLFIDFFDDKVNVQFNVSKYHSLYKNDFPFGKKNNYTINHALFHSVITDDEYDYGDEIYTINQAELLQQYSKKDENLKDFQHQNLTDLDDFGILDHDVEIILHDTNDDDDDGGGLWGFLKWIFVGGGCVIGCEILAWCYLSGTICDIYFACLGCLVECCTCCCSVVIGND